MASILEARNVRYSYSDGPEALRGLSTAIEEGKKIALVGPNGAGKSTLMLMFNGILRPTSGEVYFGGQPMKYDSPSLRNVRRKVGLVFQNPDDQLFAPTVYQDVAFGPVNLGYPKDKVEKYVNYALSYVGLSGFESRPPHHLSGGEKKRVAIAGVLAMEPEVMILDEPTSNLDPAGSEEIMEMLDELNSSGKTMIISTHDVELAYRWSDQILLMEDGKLLHYGPPAEVFADHELVSKARMKPPAVMEIYQELRERGVLDEDRPPRNILELTNLLETRAKAGCPKVSPGEIYLYNVDHADPSEIRSFMDSGAAKYVGAMGTSAKMMAEREKISLDFTFGVIDKSILKATTGQSSLILTSGGMVEHTLRRIEAYCDEWGTKIQASVLNASVLKESGNN
jgi:cobalt/nickel transport system ATP-binding protein